MITDEKRKYCADVLEKCRIAGGKVEYTFSFWGRRDDADDDVRSWQEFNGRSELIWGLYVLMSNFENYTKTRNYPANPADYQKIDFDRDVPLKIDKDNLSKFVNRFRKSYDFFTKHLMRVKYSYKSDMVDWFFTMIKEFEVYCDKVGINLENYRPYQKV